jgi:hypothetical protein
MINESKVKLLSSVSSKELKKFAFASSLFGSLLDISNVSNVSNISNISNVSNVSNASYGFHRDDKEKHEQEWKLHKRENEILKELKANETSEDEAARRLKSFKESYKNNKNIF